MALKFSTDAFLTKTVNEQSASYDFIWS